MQIQLIIALISLAMPAFSQKNIEDSIAQKLINLGSVDNNNEDYSEYEHLQHILKNVDIVMLGEQSHGDATTYETKIKLIKYLHQKMGFDILAFESGFYDCQKAWSQIQMGDDVRTSLANSIFYLWSCTKEFKPLTTYLENELTSERPLAIAGFDNQWSGKISNEYYIKDLRGFLNQLNDSLELTEEWKHLESSLTYVAHHEFKEYKKKEARKDTVYINALIIYLERCGKDTLTSFWIQSLKSTKCYLSDRILGTDFRDKQMAENLIWLKEHNPGKKIICWGATSHFIYNSSEVHLKGLPFNLLDNYYQKQPMMGHYIKQKYGAKVYTIGFVAYEGFSGLINKRKIRLPKENSLEYIIGKSNYTNCFLPLNELSLTSYLARPLGHVYMKNDISNVMDGIVFNRYMKRPMLDRDFLLKIYPVKPQPIVEER